MLGLVLLLYVCIAFVLISQDEPTAVSYYLSAARNGHVEAQFKLAWCYDIGYGVEQNSKEAFYWYKCAAHRGNIEAQYNVGVCCTIFSSSLFKSSRHARKWCEKR